MSEEDVSMAAMMGETEGGVLLPDAPDLMPGPAGIYRTKVLRAFITNAAGGAKDDGTEKLPGFNLAVTFPDHPEVSEVMEWICHMKRVGAMWQFTHKSEDQHELSKVRAKIKSIEKCFGLPVEKMIFKGAEKPVCDAFVGLEGAVQLSLKRDEQSGMNVNRLQTFCPQGTPTA